MLSENLKEADEEKIAQYFVYKGILSLIYANSYEQRFELLSEALFIDYNNFLVPLKGIINEIYILLDKTSQDNLDRIIEYFRDVYVKEHPDEKVAVYNIVNEIIILRNKSSMIGLYTFVAQGWFLRFNNQEELPNIMHPKNIFNSFEQLKYLIGQDFDILYTHFCCADEHFVEIQESFSDVNSVYLASVNKMVLECPYILKDEMVLNRIRTIIDLKKEKLAKVKRCDCLISRKVLRKNFERNKNVFYNHLFDSLTIE